MTRPSDGRRRDPARRHRVLVALYLATLLYVLLSQHLLPSGDHWGLRAGAFKGFLAATAPLKQHLEDLERQLEKDSHLRQVAQPTVQWLLTAGGAGNERVYLGRHGWLILRDGFDYLVGSPFLDPDVLKRRRRDAPAWLPPPQPDPRPAILDLGRQLAARGIRLLVLPAPTKPMIHPEALASGSVDPADPASARLLHNPSFDALRSDLEAGSVMVFDPTATLMSSRRETGREQYLRIDSHWSPQAVDAVARELADRVRLLELPFSRPQVALRRQTETIEGVGDLERLLFPRGQTYFPSQTVELRRVLTRRGQPLRADPRAEILVLGDSFTNVYSRPSSDLSWGRGAGLAEQLAFHLSRPVGRIAVNAGGATGSRRRLALEMAAGKDRLRGKKLVIWEFAVRELAVGDWQLVTLPVP